MSLSLTACDDTENPNETNEQELITTVELTFAPAMGDPLVFTWDDPEADGAPVIDTVELDVGTTYDLSIRFFNGLENPAEDITEEVRAEADEHQVFLTGDAVSGPASIGNGPILHTYADEDSAGLPLGLINVVDARAGSGDLTVTLRHLPAESGTPVKVAGLATTVADEGFAAIPGDTDAQVTFPVSGL